MKSITATVLAVAAALAPTAAAVGSDAAKSVRSGHTAEGSKVKLELGEFGNPTAFAVGKTDVRCDRGGTLTTLKTTYAEFDTSDPGAFTGRYRQISRSEGKKFKSRTRIAGSSDDEGLENWDGVLRTKTRVFKNGQRLDVCRLKTTWEAH